MRVHLVNGLLGLLVELTLYFIQRNWELPAIDHETTEEDTRAETVNRCPTGLVKYADQGTRKQRNNSEKHNVEITRIVDFTVQLEVEGTHVNLLNWEHKHGCNQNENTGVHLLVDNVTDHGPLLEGADILACAVVARCDENKQKSDCDEGTAKDGQLSQWQRNETLFDDQPLAEWWFLFTFYLHWLHWLLIHLSGISGDWFVNESALRICSDKVIRLHN